MTDISIIGVGTTSVSEKWSVSLRHLAWYAIDAAMQDADVRAVDALFVGNMLAPVASGQSHLGAMIADFAGLRGIDAVTVGSAEASGAAALRQAIIAVRSGFVQTALVVGVEKASDLSGRAFLAATGLSLDADYEQAHGMTQAAASALLMRRYLHQYGVDVADFAAFSINAHANGMNNPAAMFRNQLNAARFANGPLLADPVSLFDMAPIGDGAAALVVTTSERAADMVPQPVAIAGSSLAIDTVALHDRKQPLWLGAAERSCHQAMAQAGVSHDDIDLFELHDQTTILAALSLEACGFAAAGEGWRIAQQNRLPISTMGGLKARGNPLGATGVYQVAEVVHQLRGSAEACQLSHPKIGMTQNLGGNGATAVTHILKI